MHKIYAHLLLALTAALLTVAPVFAADDVNQNYVVTNQSTLGITRVFDDGQNTVIVFVDIEEQNPVLTDKAGKMIRFQSVGDYAVLPGIYNEVRVSEGVTHGIVKASANTSPAPTYASTPVAPAPMASATVTPQPATTSPYKAGTAVYELPFVKPAANAAPTTTPATTAALQTQKLTTNVTTHVTPPASTINIVQEAPAPKPSWTLRQGYPIGKELADWGAKAHWTVVWKYPNEIIVPSTTTFTGDFPTAAQQVIDDLAANGALIHYRTFDGNNTFLVFGPGAASR